MKYFYLILFAFLSITSAKAQTFTVGGINYEITSATAPLTVEVRQHSSFIGPANIPNTVINGVTTYTVTSIGNNAFSNNTGLTSVIIPNSVTAIGNSAFYYCTGLTSVTIPNSVTSIGEFAFYYCTGLTSVPIPNSVTSIGRYAFYYCTGLTSVTIPNSITSIGDYVFYYCFGLTSVTIPNSVTSIGNYAFARCNRLTSVTIPNSVTSISSPAFSNCSGLTSVTVNWNTPLDINGYGVFFNVNINSVTLNVPAGTANLYEAAPVWTEFNIVGGTIPAPRGCWASVSAGSQHTLAIAQDGTLWGWGSNADKQLGNNATGNVISPVQISNNPNWAFVSAGEFYSLAIKKDGTLWAWGKNSDGQLGNGTTTQINIPTQIGTDTNWVGVYAGYHHSMARKTDNTLWAWGDNTYGQLGNNTTTQQLTPIQIGTSINWQSVSLGKFHTVVLKSNGELWAWGRNNFGQLGLGNTINQNTPTQVGIETWKLIQAGNFNNLALKNNGTLYSWGDNGIGQLGLGDTTNRMNPTQIGTATDWKSIAAGLYNGYATKTTGTLWSWGDNYKGQLGNGTFVEQNSPIQVGTAINWDNVIAGNEYAIAQNNAGTFMSWGDNQSGQLGNGTTLPNNTGQNTPSVMGCAGNILAFDGVDDRVQIVNNGTGVLGNNTNNESYTIELKVKLNQGTNNIIFSKNATSPSNQGFTIGTDADGFLFFSQAYGGVFRKIYGPVPQFNRWYRVVATFDYASKTHKLYVNGVLVGSETDTGTPNFTNSDAGLGYSYGTSSGKLDGVFNDLRIWNIARTPEDVSAYTRSAQAVNTVPNLIAHYKFNQGIANANNVGLITLANEVVGGPVGTLQNFELTGSTSNWTQDTTANETVVLGVDNFNFADTVKVYPNPSTGIFTITLQENAAVTVTDLLGKTIITKYLKSGFNTIDISNYQSGLYLMNITTENGSVTKKIIKE